MKPFLVFLLNCFAFGMVFLAGYFFRRARKPDRTRAKILYLYECGQKINVNACGCPNCKNVIWAQRVHIEPPLYCAYCGTKFTGSDYTDDEGIREYIVSDE
jgi:hypothetical protein